MMKIAVERRKSESVDSAENQYGDRAVDHENIDEDGCWPRRYLASHINDDVRRQTTNINKQRRGKGQNERTTAGQTLSVQRRDACREFAPRSVCIIKGCVSRQ